MKLNFNTGLEKIEINGNPNDVIYFNPHDLSFPSKFFKFQDFVIKMANSIKEVYKTDDDVFTTIQNITGIPVI